jgi:hypothetical protein
MERAGSARHAAHIKNGLIIRFVMPGLVPGIHVFKR